MIWPSLTKRQHEYRAPCVTGRGGRPSARFACTSRSNPALMHSRVTVSASPRCTDISRGFSGRHAMCGEAVRGGKRHVGSPANRRASPWRSLALTILCALWRTSRARRLPRHKAATPAPGMRPMQDCGTGRRGVSLQGRTGDAHVQPVAPARDRSGPVRARDRAGCAGRTVLAALRRGMRAVPGPAQPVSSPRIACANIANSPNVSLMRCASSVWTAVRRDSEQVQDTGTRLSVRDRPADWRQLDPSQPGQTRSCVIPLTSSFPGCGPVRSTSERTEAWIRTPVWTLSFVALE